VAGIRVRFSPAPTGYLHVGSARTALFNWLFARHTGGELLLRIEDTDLARNKPELIDSIVDALDWLGIDFDGEPVHQSERADAHAAAVDQLIEAGAAYRCDCTGEEVQQRAKERGGPPGYDGHCRERGVAPGPGVAVRFRTPDDGTTAWDDVVRGTVEFPNSDLEDFVIARSDGTPTFILANALDDADMGITHVIRGEDLVNVTPKGILLRHALGLTDLPVYAHLPLLVNEQRKKLSKRRDDVSLGDYRDRGYLAPAMANYLALLGWGPPDGVEIRPIAEIVELFELEHVNKAPAFFDVKKLTHFNGEYIRAMDSGAFVAAAEPFLAEAPWPPESFDAGVFARVAPLVQERTHVLTDVVPMVDFLFLDQPETDADDWDQATGKVPAAEILDATIAAYSECDWSADTLHHSLAEIGERHGLKLGQAQAPVRVAVTGRRVGPPLFESLEVLGRDRALERLRGARARLG
jgi:glutamyl-tRNA synthetase